MMSTHRLKGTLLGLFVALFVASGGALALPGEDGKSVAAVGAPAAIAAPPMSDFIEIRIDDRENQSPSVAYNDRLNEYLVVWEEHIHGGEVAIYGRRVAGNGSPMGPAFAVWHVQNEQHSWPDVAYCPKSGNYLVVWSYKHSATDTDIHGRLIGGSGQPGNHLAIDGGLDRDGYPAVACSTQADEFLVVFEKYIGTTRRDIEAWRVGASNGSLETWRNIAGGANQVRRLPDVAYNRARNEYLIAYTFQASPTAGGDIVGRRSSFNMGWLSSEFYISPTGYPPQDGVALAGGPDEYMAVWDEDHGATTYSIWGRRVRGDGGLESFIQVAHDTGQKHVEPAVAFGDGGHYLVPWRHIAGAHPAWDIYGRMVSPSSNAPDGVQFPIDAWPSAQKVPAVACAPSGPCLVAYEDEWPGPDYEIRGRLVGHARAFLPLLKR